MNIMNEEEELTLLNLKIEVLLQAIDNIIVS